MGTTSVFLGLAQKEIDKVYERFVKKCKHTVVSSAPPRRFEASSMSLDVWFSHFYLSKYSGNTRRNTWQEDTEVDLSRRVRTIKDWALALINLSRQLIQSYEFLIHSGNETLICSVYREKSMAKACVM
jgi:hypothetical protein